MNSSVDLGFLMFEISMVYSFWDVSTVVLMTILVEMVTVQAVCPFTVQIMLVGLRRETNEGNVVIRNPF